MNGREMSSQTSAKQTRRKQTNSQKQPLNKRMVESADSHSPPKQQKLSNNAKNNVDSKQLYIQTTNLVRIYIHSICVSLSEIF